VLVLHFKAFRAISAASLPGIVVELFGVKRCGRLRYRLSGLFCQPQHLYSELCPSGVVAGNKPDNRLARLSKRQLRVARIAVLLPC
jgi:hypothetical protein